MGNVIKILTNEERRTCHNLFRKNDLFRHWHPILSDIEGITGIDATSVWYNADVILRNLRACIEYRDDEMNFIHSEFEREHKKEAVSAIMAVVLTRLMNATEEGHEEERIANDVICNALLKLHCEDTFFDRIMNVFFKRNIGNDGNKVVITPSDPMTQNTSLDDMDEVAKGEIEAKINRVMELTQGLNVYFKDWEKWRNLWKSICTDAELETLLDKISPNKNSYGINLKMICNVVGMYVSQLKIDVPVLKINNAISNKNLSSYISQPKDFGGSNSALTSEQYIRIIAMME